MSLSDDYVLVGCSMLPNDENYIFITDKDGNLLKKFDNASNSFLLPDARISNKQQNDNYVYFDDVEVVDAKGNLITKFDAKDLNHECIYGSNQPRYYTPTFDYKTVNKNILAIVSEVKHVEEISKHDILDNSIVEYDTFGNVIWEWSVADNYDKLDLSDKEKQDIHDKNLKVVFFGEQNDFVHLNSACEVGKNKWYDAGDDRFKPDNIICCSRHMSRVFIINRETKEIVYTMDCRQFGVEHQHYAHIIPEGIDGAGNILLFHGHSKEPCFIEINPVTLEVVFKHIGNFRTNGMGNVQKMPDGKYLVGCSLRKKAVVVDSEHNETDIIVPQIFYRINAYPKQWIEKHM